MAPPPAQSSPPGKEGQRRGSPREGKGLRDEPELNEGPEPSSSELATVPPQAEVDLSLRYSSFFLDHNTATP